MILIPRCLCFKFGEICCVELRYDHFNIDFRLVTGWAGGGVGWGGCVAGWVLVQNRDQLWLINSKIKLH